MTFFKKWQFLSIKVAFKGFSFENDTNWWQKRWHQLKNGTKKVAFAT
jgi:hypothetical protein